MARVLEITETPHGVSDIRRVYIALKCKRWSLILKIQGDIVLVNNIDQYNIDTNNYNKWTIEELKSVHKGKKFQYITYTHFKEKYFLYIL